MKVMEIKVRTPPRQAEKTMKKQIDALIGFKKQKDILKKEVINDHEFIIHLQYTDKEYEQIHKKLFRAEILIKEFYKTLFKFIHRINRIIKIGNKFGKAGKKGLEWIFKKVQAMLQKEIPDANQRKEFFEQLGLETIEIENSLFKPLEITDEETMKKFLEGELITTRTL